MIVKKAEYKVKEDKLDLVRSAIKTFTTCIHQNEPTTYYEAFQVEGSTEFIHLMKFSDMEAEEKHKDAGYTTDFVKVLYPNCVEEPQFTDLLQLN